MSAGNLLEALTDNLVVDKTKCIFCGKCAETCILDNIRINRAPCSAACPLGLNIQGYVQLVARGKDDEARQAGNGQWRTVGIPRMLLRGFARFRMRILQSNQVFVLQPLQGRRAGRQY